MNRDVNVMTHTVSTFTLIQTRVVAEDVLEDQKWYSFWIFLYFQMCFNVTATADIDWDIIFPPGDCWWWVVAEMNRAVNLEVFSKGSFVNSATAHFNFNITTWITTWKWQETSKKSSWNAITLKKHSYFSLKLTFVMSGNTICMRRNWEWASP